MMGSLQMKKGFWNQIEMMLARHSEFTECN